MSKKLVVISLLAFGLDANAQQNWTLKQCIEYGLKNNGNNTIYANQKLIADARAKQVLADYLPRVTLTSTLDNNLKLRQSIVPAGVLGADEVRFSFTQKYSSDAVAQVDQVIFNQSLLTGLRAGKYYKMQADLHMEQSQEAIIYNISIAYCQIFVYNQQLKHLEYNKATYEKQMGIYLLRVSKGVTLQKDLDKVTVDYNNTSSQIRVAHSNLQLAQNELKFEMGFPIDEILAVDSSTEIGTIVLSGDSDKIFSAARRTDYRLSELNIKALEIEQSRIKAEAFPTLSGYARYGAVGFGNKLKGAYDQLLPYSTVGLKLSIPLFDFYKRNARYKEAKLNRVNAEENQKLTERRFKVEYENASSKLLQAKTNMENDQRNVALAESVLKVTDLQFQKGITNLADWLNTQNSLKEAQNSYLNALFSYYQARINLEKATGTLKTFYNSLWK